MPERLVEIGGTRVFVDDGGDASAPALLFIHGGPGQGGYDFMRSQGDLLAAYLRIIGMHGRDHRVATPEMIASVSPGMPRCSRPPVISRDASGECKPCGQSQDRQAPHLPARPARNVV